MIRSLQTRIETIGPTLPNFSNKWNSSISGGRSPTYRVTNGYAGFILTIGLSSITFQQQNSITHTQRKTQEFSERGDFYTEGGLNSLGFWENLMINLEFFLDFFKVLLFFWDFF